MPILQHIEDEHDDQEMKESTETNIELNIIRVTSKGKANLAQYYFEFEISNSNTEEEQTNEKQTVKLHCRGREELDVFVSQLEEKFTDLYDIRFIHSNHIIILSESFSTIFKQDFGEVFVYINEVEYILDLDNVNFQQGNSFYHKKNFKKAIEKYKLSIQRYPNHLQTLYHSCLAYQKLNNVDGSISDCVSFFDKIKNIPVEDYDTTIEDLIPKFYLRLGRSYFQKAKELIPGVENESEESMEQRRIELLKFSKLSIEAFSSLDESFFEGRTESLTEFDHVMNLFFLLNDNNLIDICGICRKKNCELVERYLVPEEIVNESKEENGSLLKIKFTCQECHEKIRKRELNFYNKIWVPFYDKEKQLQFQETQGYLYYFLCSISFFNLNCKSFFQLKYDEKVSKKYHQLRNYLLLSEEEEEESSSFNFNLPEINLVIPSEKLENEEENENAKVLNQYLTGFNFDLHTNFLDSIEFVHTQFKHFHCCCLINDNGYSWDYSYRIQPNDMLLDVPKEEERQWPKLLHFHISQMLDLQPMTEDDF